MAFGKKAAAAVIAVAPEVGPLGSFVDGVVMLAGHPTDPRGRPLRP